MENTITTQFAVFMAVKDFAVSNGAVAYFCHNSQREGKIFLHRMTGDKVKHLASIHYNFDTTGVDILIYPPGMRPYLPPISEKENRPAEVRIDFFVDDFMAPLRESLKSLIKE